jgi:hypothetical protein
MRNSRGDPIESGSHPNPILAPDRRMYRTTILLVISVFSVALILPAQVRAESFEQALTTLAQVNKDGAGHAAAVESLPQVTGASIDKLPQVLAAMKGVNPIAQNWLRGAADEMVMRAEAAGQPLPLAELTAFVQDTEQAPRGRRIAYEIIAARQPDVAKRLLAGMLNDPSMELRRDACAALLAEAKAAVASEPAVAIERYQLAVTSARDLDQVEQAERALKELGQPVKLADVLGYLTSWQVIGLFTNVGGKGFDAVFPPEESFDPDAEYTGKHGSVSWKPVTTADAMGKVDLNAALAEEKEVTAYARTTLTVDTAQAAEIRISSYNATKAWVNGKLVANNEVYHSGEQFDQYIAPCELKAGENVILVKCLQNAQTQSWARHWRFSLRVTDDLGTPVK